MNCEEREQQRREKQKLYNKKHYENHKIARQQRNREYYAKLKACCEDQARPHHQQPQPQQRPPINPPPIRPLVDYSSDENNTKIIPAIANKRQPKRQQMVLYDSDDEAEWNRPIDNVGQAVIDFLKNRKLANGNQVAENTVKIDLNNVKLLTSNCVHSLEECMKNLEHIQQLTQPWGISKKQTFFRTFNLIGDWMYKRNLITKQMKESYAKFNKVSSLENRDNQVANMDKQYPAFSEYMAKLKATYPLDSKEYLLSKLYEENSGVRDAYSKANVYNEIHPESVPGTIGTPIEQQQAKENYFVIKRAGPAQFVLNKHKTGNGDRFVFSYSASVSKLLREYMTTSKIAYGNPLFGNVSSLFSRVNKKLGYKDIAGTNAFRHMILTELLAGKNLTAEQRVEISKRFNHSPEMSVKYIRQVITAESSV